MTSVLITGANGFIGRCLSEEARQRGFQVASMGRRSAPGIAVVHDLCQPIEHISVPDWVFHLAGGYAGADLRALQSHDVVIARNLLDWGAANRVRNWVFASAAEVYGAVPGLASEETVTRPVIPYGAVKLDVEHLFADFAARFPGSRVVVLRIGEVYGANGRLVQELEARFRRGFCPWFGNGMVPLSFVHVKDVAQAFIDAAHCAQTGFSIYNIADDEPTTWREFLQFMSTLLGTRGPVFLPLPLAHVYATAAILLAKASGASPIVTQNIVRLLTTPKKVSNLKAKSHLGLNLRYRDYRAGLKQTLCDLADGTHKEDYIGIPHHAQNG
jgi:UDP-glucose 4-epimerase